MEQESRYFCIVYAQDRQQLVALARQEMDLFQPTARITDAKEHAIDGLLSAEEVFRLVDKGYRVLVEEHEVKRSRALDNSISAEEWIEEFRKNYGIPGN